jgi:hypothetical protein
MAFTSSVALLLLLLLPALCISDDRLVPGKPLSPGTTVVSDGGEFALGFFAPSKSTPDKLYLGIWYSNILRFTVVWVANRATPANSSMAPRLVLTNDSNLVLSDDANGGGGRVLWTTNTTTTTTTTTTAGPGRSSEVVLMNTGNLALQSPSGKMLWQSFDHPTDTLLPGMKLKLWSRSHKTRQQQGTRLFAWKDPSDPSAGAVSFTAQTEPFLQGFIWNGSLPEWRTSVWTGVTVSNQSYNSQQPNTSAGSSSSSLGVSTTLVETADEVFVTLTVSGDAPPVMIVLTYSGRVETNMWSKDAAEWALLTAWPDSGLCSSYGYCGPSGYCDHTDDAAPTCKCLDGFEPVDADEWRNARFSRGCQRKEALGCGGGGDGFLALPAMKLPDKFERIERKTLEECVAECRGNCSCVAYAYANLNGSTSDGDATRCLVWIGDHQLVDAQKMGVPRYTSTTAADSLDTLHLRVAGGGMLSGTISYLPHFSCFKTRVCQRIYDTITLALHGQIVLCFAGKRTKTNTIKIVLPALAGVIVLTTILLTWACKFRGMFSFCTLVASVRHVKTSAAKHLLEAARERNKTLIHGGYALDELGEEKATDDFELPFLKFQDILAATNNFSNTFMIGQGGFGKVYKVL